MRGRSWGAVVVLGLLLLGGIRVGFAGSEAETSTWRIRYADGRLDQRVEMRRLAAPAQEWFVGSADLAAVLQVGRYWRTDVRKLVLRVDDQRITFTVGARSVVGGRETVLLRHPVDYSEGEIWIPLEFVTQILPRMTGRKVTLFSDAQEIVLGTRALNVQGLAVTEVDGRTELRLRLTEPLAFRVDDSRPQDLRIKIYGGRLDPGQISLDRRLGLIETVSARQAGDDAEVRVRISELARSYQSLTEDTGRTLLLRIEPAPVTVIPEPVPRGRHLVQTLPPEARGREVVVRRVVIDPGHGGTDTGATGRGGLREKDVTLAVARELERLLESRYDIDAVLTREDDIEVGLVERTERANREKADLFLSLHCNDWREGSAQGVETYFLTPTKGEEDARQVRAENADVGAAEDLDFLLWDLAQNAFVQESATLAEGLQQHLVRETGLANRGVKQAGLRVLVGAYMPAALVELGFVSNVDDAARLSDRGWQKTAARALAEAIVEFRARMDAVRERSR